jgi:hypothetical protein
MRKHIITQDEKILINGACEAVNKAKELAMKTKKDVSIFEEAYRIIYRAEVLDLKEIDDLENWKKVRL